MFEGRLTEGDPVAKIDEIGQTSSLTITVLVDNRADLLVKSVDAVRRFTKAPLLAEHGFAALVELKEAGIAYKSGQFPMRALGRSRASMDTDGFVKILADKSTDEVLGVHMIGARVADLIAEAVTAMEYRASAEDIARMSHAHPTYAEAVKEAALAATGDRALHS